MRSRGEDEAAAGVQTAHVELWLADISRAEQIAAPYNARRTAHWVQAAVHGRAWEKKSCIKKAFTNSRSHVPLTHCRVKMCRGVMLKLMKIVRGCSGMRAWLPAANMKKFSRPSAYPRGSVTSRVGRGITWLSMERYSPTLSPQGTTSTGKGLPFGIMAIRSHVDYQRSKDRKAERSRRRFRAPVPNESAQPAHAGGSDAHSSLYAPLRLEPNDSKHPLKPDACALATNEKHSPRIPPGDLGKMCGGHNQKECPPRGKSQYVPGACSIWAT